MYELVLAVFFYFFHVTLSGSWMGMALYGLRFGVPAALLAGVLERPFVGKNGPGRQIVWYAIQANLLSMLLVYLGGWIQQTLMIWPLMSHQLRMWGPILLFLFVILVEYCYLALRGVIGWRKWWRIVLGNFFSALFIGLVTTSVFTWQQDPPLLRLGNWPQFLMILGWVVGITGLILAFWLPWRAKRRAALESPKPPVSAPG